MKKLIYIIVFLALLPSCSEYQKALKSTDHEVKYAMAQKLYQQEKYGKLIPLLEDIVYLYKGTDKGSELMTELASSYYKTGDYIMAGYYYRRLVADYPKDPKAEEAQYLSAYCYYLDAPRPTLDQSPTDRAIREFQIFIRKYPTSDRIADCNKYVDELYKKLQNKSYLNSKFYYELERYKSANIAIANSLQDYPDSPHREELLFLLVKSNYMLAKNSIASKQQERYEDTLKEYENYKTEYPQGQYTKEADKIASDAKKRLTQFL
jgi:outer membrane protein assembly factor BamD